MNDSEKLKSIIKDIKFTMLTTSNQDGTLHSRPMATLDASHYDGTLRFFSRKSSGKNHSIEADQNVNLAYSNSSKNQYASVFGTANIFDNKERMKKFWSEDLKTWFPDGLDDSELSLIEVNVSGAEIWDNEKHFELKNGGNLMSDEEKLDETIDESFPASDAPGHFAKSEEDLKRY